ncbi:MAG: ABC transporter ATP-binding protein [Verrucomicrobiales bacterium]|nr:ABC transporter ATP-binding protein [Verrucomicrobiales bacterium]
MPLAETDDGDFEPDERFFAKLPEDLSGQVNGGDVLVSMETDTKRDGSFGPAYLVLTESEALALEEGEDPLRIPFSEIESAENDELFGGGRILLKTKADEKISLINHSRNLVPEFAAATRIIDDEANGRDWIFPELEGPAFSEGGVPLPERGGRSPLDMPRGKIFRRMWQFMKPYQAKTISFMILIAISVLAQMAVPLITKYIVDDILRDSNAAAESVSRLNFYVSLLALSFVIILSTRIFANVQKVWISGRLTTDLRNQLHRQMQRLKMGYHNKKESGELIGRVMNDTADLQHFFVDGVPFILINALMFVGIGTILLVLHPLLALCVFLPVPLLLGGGTWFWKKLVPLFHKRSNRISVLHSTLGESIKGVQAVKALGQESRRHRTFTGGNEDLFGVGFRVEKTFVSFFEVMAFCMGLGTVAVWYFGGHAILDKTFSVGDLVAFIGYMAMFYGPLQWFTAVVNWMTHAFASSERILQVLDQKPEAYDDPDALPLPRTKGKIEFDNVRFSYNRGKEIIKGISFEIQPGEMIGLVGKSGAGKSTIINLVCRFYDVDSGEIRVDGHDIRKIKLQDWRKNIGIVMQDPFLFSASIAENIAYGTPGATFEDIVRAARAAEAHEFILDKEEGYDTVVGEGGVDLSGGEKQRLAIARAILNDPPVLILDEATSAVDSETEKAIQAAISNLVKGRTTIAIAHRLATLRNADRLVVIEDGRVIEQGNHEELLEKEDGHFANLVKLQAENNQLRGEQIAYSME